MNHYGESHDAPNNHADCNKWESVDVSHNGKPYQKKTNEENALAYSFPRSINFDTTTILRKTLLITLIYETLGIYFYLLL